MSDLIERLVNGVVEHPKRWSGDTHYDLGGSVDYEATGELMDNAAQRILADAEALKAADEAHETGDDVIRAANTLSLMLCGDLAMTKTAIETAVKRFLSARSEWDERMTAYRKARGGE